MKRLADPGMIFDMDNPLVVKYPEFFESVEVADGGTSNPHSKQTGGTSMNDRRERQSWPVGYRLLLWAVGVLLVLTIIVTILFLATAPR